MNLAYRERFELLLLELQVLKDHISRYDQNGMTLKSVCLTSWSAISAFAVINNDPTIVLISVAIVLGFSLVEFTYRRYQWRFTERAAEVERVLASGDLTGYTYSIDSAARKGNLRQESLSTLRQPHFVLFYLLLALVSIAGYVYLRLVRGA
jgi:hypothetical protein